MAISTTSEGTATPSPESLAETEAERSAALAEYDILDTPREEDFDDLAKIAAEVCGTPIGVVNFVDTTRQFFKAEVGLGVRETPLESSFCGQAILAEDMLVVPDATKDPRFECNPLVLGDPGLRFYAGAILRTPQGYPIGTICVLDYRPHQLDAHQIRTLKLLARQAMTQLELRRSLSRYRTIEERHRQILDSAVDFAIITTDLSGIVTSWNVGAERIMGWSEAEMVGNPADAFFTPEDRMSDIPELEMSAARKTERGIDERWHVRKNGDRFWASGEIMMLKDGRDRHVGYLKILRDRTQQREEEQRRVALTQELSHRMKNSLTMVQAIVAQTFRTAKTMEEGRGAISGRLAALAGAQEVLTRSSGDSADIRDVVEAALFPHRDSAERFDLSGPSVRLTPEQGLGLSLAIHELSTNAVKYGALSGPEGDVRISWAVGPDGAFSLEWLERGGPRVEMPTRTGFGSRLVERIVANYFSGAASLSFDPGGVRFHLTGTVFP